MGVTMTMKGLSDLGQGRWEYRRRVPASAKEALGKSEWKRVIRARSDADLVRQYAQVVAEFEREVAAATKPKRAMTPREAWEAALREADSLTLGALGLEPDEAREVVAESLAAAGERPLTVQALMDPGRSPPGFTVEDARRVYVEEKLGGGKGPEHRGTMVRLDRVMRLAEDAGLSAATALTSVTREHARKVRDHMAGRTKNGGDGRVSPASVKRELGLLRTVLSYGARELGVAGWSNPFEKLPIKGVTSVTGKVIPEDEKRDPLPVKVIAAMRGKLQGDLLLIWRILEGTGAHGKEVVGIRREDVVLDGDFPFMRLRWHEGRRLKGRSRIRPLPLVGDTLDAVRAAVAASDDPVYLFPRYARKSRGADSLSGILMKHLRDFTTNERHVVYSLRHGMKDRMRKAGVDKASQDVVLGHAPANVGENYGSEEGRLAVALRALQAVEAMENPRPR